MVLGQTIYLLQQTSEHLDVLICFYLKLFKHILKLLDLLLSFLIRYVFVVAALCKYIFRAYNKNSHIEVLFTI